ncbi:gustatory receptor for sugar taste 43a-like [Schistocerca americana]|uniref:gustatory receptor for sugar taste 43a-like n=1 Tax=Schistocerca americana TaxID=7009 RepID=UPI001F4FDA6B|nr:gustatory receptor for sugar taste 43a-like [Schistocerca americana]
MKCRIEDGAHTARHRHSRHTPSAKACFDSSQGSEVAPPEVWNSLQPLVALSALVGVPPCRPRWSATLDAVSRLYSLAVLCSLVYMGYSAAARVIQSFRPRPNCYSYFVPRLLGCGVVTSAACASVLALLAARCDWLCTFSAELQRVDDLLGVDKWKAHRTTKLYLFISLGLLMTAYIGIVTWDTIIASYYDVLTEIIVFVITITFEQFFIFALIIRYRFLMLNEAVLHMFSYQKETLSMTNITATTSRQCHLSPLSLPSKQNSLKQSTWPASCDQLLTVKVAHNKLSNLASALNEVYTVPITAMVLQALTSGVQVIFNVLLLLLDEEEDNNVLVLPDICYVVMTTINVVALACCCQSTVSQARRTASIAEDLIVANAAAGDSEAASQQLRQLSRQVRHSPVSFSACSLFSVDATMLAAFLSTVATYTIILLQFAVSNNSCIWKNFPLGTVGSDTNETTSPLP